jgi:hypothetical protein
LKEVPAAGEAETVFGRAAAYGETGIVDAYRLIMGQATHFPGAAAVAGDEVDHAAEGVGSVEHAHRPFDDLHPFYFAKGQLIQVDASADAAYYGHAVDEDFDILAGEALHLEERA